MSIYSYNDLSYVVVDSSYISIVGGNPIGTLTIPSDISHVGISYPVQEISSNAFQDASNITALDASNSNLITIGNFAFHRITSLTTVDLRNSKVTTIGNSALSETYSLHTIYFPETLETLGIESCAYNDLTSVIFPSNCNLTEISNEAFVVNNNLTLMDFTNCIKISTIGANAFKSSNSLTSITFGGLAPSIASTAFSSINSSANIYVNWWANFGSSYGTSPVVPVVKMYNDISYEIIDSSYVNIISYNSNLVSALDNPYLLNGSLTIPDSINNYPVRTLKNYNFQNLLALTLIVIPSNIQQMGENTFENCSNLRRITYLGPCPFDLNTTGISSSKTPFKNLPSDAKIYVYYEYSVTNSNNTGIGPYYLTEYQRASTIPVIIIDPPPPPPPPPCICPPKAILDKSLDSYKEGQNSSKLFTRINALRYSRVKRTIHISQSNFTNICDPRINLNININTVINSQNQSFSDNVNSLNNSINCINRKRFGAFLAGLKNA